MLIRLFPLLLLFLASCAKPKYTPGPCDLDLGYSSGKMHLSNVKFLAEDRAIDWFEIYENLERRRGNRPAADCIPGEKVRVVEQTIEHLEHSLKNLR
jgi:hypothetical protein